MLSKKEIGQYLHEMDEILTSKGLHGEIVLCGGAVMSYVFDARHSTKDIDALFAPSDTMRLISARIAEKYQLEDDWFNDAAKAFIDSSRMNFVEVEKMKSLTISRPDDKAMLAMKLASAREDTKDANDAKFLIRRLGINSKEELLDILEENIAPQQLTPMASFFAQEILAQMKDEDSE